MSLAPVIILQLPPYPYLVFCPGQFIIGPDQLPLLYHQRTHGQSAAGQLNQIDLSIRHAELPGEVMSQRLMLTDPFQSRPIAP